MVKTVSKSEFMDDLRDFGFSYKGLDSLFDYLEDVYEESYEFDAIGVAGDWSEYDDFEAYLEDGNTDAETINELENVRTVVFIKDLEGRKTDGFLVSG